LSYAKVSRREAPILVEPAVETAGERAEGLDVVAHRLLVQDSGRREEPDPFEALGLDPGDARIAIHVLGRPRLERGAGQLDEALAVRVAAVVRAQHAGLGDGVERGVAHGVVELAGDEMMALAVHLDPLDAALLHLARDVTQECVFGLVVVVVAVEEGAVESIHRGLQGVRH
jgi:hypothetical protein